MLTVTVLCVQYIVHLMSVCNACGCAATALVKYFDKLNLFVFTAQKPASYGADHTLHNRRQYNSDLKVIRVTQIFFAYPVSSLAAVYKTVNLI